MCNLCALIFMQLAHRDDAIARLDRHQIMNPGFVLLAGALLALPAAAHAQAPDRLQTILTSGVLRVGTTMDTPVFSMRDPASGKLGFDMDALETLGPLELIMVRQSG